MTEPLTDQSPLPPRWRHLGVAAVTVIYFAGLVIALFGVELLWQPRAVVSAAEMDIDRQFYAWRAFAFGAWRETGRPPLWNPYPFGGVPALGNVQYALVYPPNWLHLVMPTMWAINLVAALHVWLAGVLTAAWCRSRRGSLVASLVGGTVFALSGPYLLHLYAGHLTYLCVVAWTPLVFLAVDRIINATYAPDAVALRGDGAKPHVLPSMLIGAAAVSMQGLGGYPQPAFYAALAVGVYAGVRVIVAAWNVRDEPRARALFARGVRAATWVGAMYLLGAALAAAQLLPAIESARQSVRAGETDYAFATSYSLPPENLLTLIVPYPFGDDFAAPYAGRWVLWEMSLFVGGVAVTLAACGTVASRRGPEWAALGVLVVAVLLALGAHTPAFRIVYELVPGAGRFRAPARFAFLAALMIAALAARGFDLLLLGGAFLPRGALGIVSGVAAVALLVASAAAQEVRQLTATGIIFLQLAVVLLLAARVPRIAYVLPLLLVFELWRPAARTIEWHRPRAQAPPQWADALAAREPHERVVSVAEPWLNLTTLLGVPDAWGYDPATSARWAALVGPMLGAEARRGDFAPTRAIAETARSPVWEMLRVKHALGRQGATQLLPSDGQLMPRVALIDQANVVEGPAASLAAVRAATFDPRRRVILESPPAPMPMGGAGAPGVARVVAERADALEIVAELTRPAILLITDAYSGGWRVRGIEPGAQREYAVMPANHALRAVPLSAGRHHVIMEYRPVSVRAGVWVSGLALLGLAGMCGLLVVSARSPGRGARAGARSCAF